MQNNSVKISTVIITLNEEKNIARCINSIKDIADEILVVDSYSTDRTKEICLSLGARFTEHKFENFVRQKKYATSLATYDHILFIDADEALSDELKKSIVEVKKNWQADAYRFNCLANFCGKWIKHCGWYPNPKRRLWDRKKGEWREGDIHESFIMAKDAKIIHLKGDLLHYTYHSLEQFVRQLNDYTTFSAQEYFKRDKKVVPWLHTFLYPPFVFLHRYFLKLGFLDGYMGFTVCKNAAYYKFLKYAKLRELYKQNPK